MRVHHATCSPLYWPLYEVETIRSEACVVCGRPATNQHHIVWRSWGEAWDREGNQLPKPTVSLCGFGNASGCHGLAHHRMLHFRNVGDGLEYLMTAEPTRYEKARDMEGWRRV